MSLVDPEQHTDMKSRWLERHTFIDPIMEVDLPLGWNPLNLSVMMGPPTQMSIWMSSSHRPTFTLIDSFDTLVNRFSSQYATSWSHRSTSATLASLCQADDEPLHKFIDKFGRLAIQIKNLNHEVELHSMLLTLPPSMFVDNLCKKPPNNMDKLWERAKGYIQMKEMSRFQNKVR